ncbi:MAG: vesicle-fusing ATPase [Bacillariaceae sp.]|jgi:vesicle-fusing ATPase
MADTSGKTDIMTPSILGSIATIAKDKNELQKKIEEDDVASNSSSSPAAVAAASRVSEMIAKAGSGEAFEGQTLGVGGLDDVLEQIKRRIWTPLAAPPKLLSELGIHPARGLLLYGKPGCGKSLLASTLGSMLSPFRPITVISGPEILDKFVGSSEKNLRDIFDNPPDIYDKFRLNEADGGDLIASAALHVIVMDEFDAVARSRGGSDGKGGQGDAGVARDSVVNQLLAKMDGVQPLAVPTLVIGLTNKRSLVEPGEYIQ